MYALGNVSFLRMGRYLFLMKCLCRHCSGPPICIDPSVQIWEENESIFRGIGPLDSNHHFDLPHSCSKHVQCEFNNQCFPHCKMTVSGPSGLLTNTDYYGFNTDMLITF